MTTSLYTMGPALNTSTKGAQGSPTRSRLNYLIIMKKFGSALLLRMIVQKEEVYYVNSSSFEMSEMKNDTKKNRFTNKKKQLHQHEPVHLQ